MKKIISLVIIVIIALLFICITCNLFRSYNTIGLFIDPEYEKIQLYDGTIYMAIYDRHSCSDRGYIIGKIGGTNSIYIAYSVKEDTQREYIYVVSCGRGRFFKKTN